MGVKKGKESLWFGMGTFSWNRELSGHGQVELRQVAGVQGKRRGMIQSKEANHTEHTRGVLTQQHFLFSNT